jgi:hypothetical protein
MDLPVNRVRVLVETSSSNEHYDGGCSAMYLELTPYRAQLCLRRIETFKTLKESNPQLLELAYADYSPSWLDPWEDEALGKVYRDLCEREALELPESVAISDSLFKRTDYGRMWVDGHGVRFSCDVGDITITSRELSMELLQKAAGSRVEPKGQRDEQS